MECVIHREAAIGPTIAPDSSLRASKDFKKCSTSELRAPDLYLAAVAIDRTITHFLAALTFAQRALCAAAILLRPAAEIVLSFSGSISSRACRPSQTL